MRASSSRSTRTAGSPWGGLGPATEQCWRRGRGVGCGQGSSSTMRSWANGRARGRSLRCGPQARPGQAGPTMVRPPPLHTPASHRFMADSGGGLKVRPSDWPTSPVLAGRPSASSWPSRPAAARRAACAERSGAPPAAATAELSAALRPMPKQPRAGRTQQRCTRGPGRSVAGSVGRQARSRRGMSR